MVPDQSGKIFTTIFKYCALIILGPVASFFASKVLIFEGIFGSTSAASSVWSAIIAVIVLHVFVGMYIYRAYSEPSKPKPDKLD